MLSKPVGGCDVQRDQQSEFTNTHRCTFVPERTGGGVPLGWRLGTATPKMREDVTAGFSQARVYGNTTAVFGVVVLDC